MMNLSSFLALLLVVTLVAGQFVNECANAPYNNVPNNSPAADPQAPEEFYVSFGTNVTSSDDPIVMKITRAWAPLGVDRFFQLIADKYYQNAAFFRVVPDFVIQFGIAASPDETKKWNTNIPDDPVLKSNKQWTLTYATAGPGTRTSQVFINLVDNARLDDQGFAPFGEVVSGFDTVKGINNPTPGSSDGANQELYTKKGNEWILNKYPDVSIITCVEQIDQLQK